MAKRRRWSLSKEEILAAADALARRTSFDFSMRDLAADLQTWPNSIYFFYENKRVLQAALLDQVLERALMEETVAHFLDPSEPWQNRIRQLALSLFDQLSAYEGAGHMITHFGLTGSNAGLRLFQMYIHFGTSIGLTPERAATILQVSFTLMVTLSDLAAAKRNGNANPDLFKASGLPTHPDPGIQAAAERILTNSVRDRAVAGIDLFTRAIESELQTSQQG